MKAILVVDMPEMCNDCILCIAEHGFFGDTVKSECLIRQKDNMVYLDGTKIPDWCPLKPIPEKQHDLSTDEGWWRDYELYEMQND